jgi:hypothetical protein
MIKIAFVGAAAVVALIIALNREEISRWYKQEIREPIEEIIRRMLPRYRLKEIYQDSLSWDDIVEWFKARQEVVISDEQHIAFTFMDNRQALYRIVQGVFNQGSKEVVDGRVIKANRIDETLSDAHRQNSLVIYS